MAPVQETVPAEPFARWLNDRLGRLVARPDIVDLRGAVTALLYEIGWDKPSAGAGVRKLYRFRHQQMSGSEGGRKGTRHAERFPRATVEEALNHAGVLFEDVYPDIAAREELELEPERWCPGCQSGVTPIDGLCPFCEWRVGPATGQRLLGKRIRGKGRS